MQKRWCVALCVLFLAAALGAQEETGGALLNVNKYSSYFLNTRGRVDSQYIGEVSDDEYDRFSVLSGNLEKPDTPLEVSLLTYYSQGIINIRPVEAKNILPANTKTSELKLGVAVYQEMRILRFLGDTAAAGRHEGILQFITGRGNATGAEIEAYYRQHIGALIAAVVDAEFKDVTIATNTKTAIQQALSGFFLTPNQTNYNGLKRYKYQDVITYELAEQRATGHLGQADSFEAMGMKGAAEAARQASASARDLANTMKPASAYFDALRALHPVIADKVLQESR
jgi:hypothetical protein